MIRMTGFRYALAAVAIAGLVAATAIPLAKVGQEPGGPEDAAASRPAVPGFQAFHYRSDLAPQGLREVFIVDTVDAGVVIRTADVELRKDGAPKAVEWQDADENGIVSPGDLFSFVEEPFDSQHILSAHVGDAQLMTCRYAGGAGMGFTPTEWRQMGQPEQVGCLPEMDINNDLAGHVHGVDDAGHHDDMDSEPYNG